MNVLKRFQSLGAGLSRVTERWIPDSWVICMILTGITILLAVFGAGAGSGEPIAGRIEGAVLAWGGGMWNLLELAMQFTLAMVVAHACVSSRKVFHLLDRIAAIPNPERPGQAIVVACMFSYVTGYLNWAFCIVSCALFVPFLCKHNPKADVRVLIVACFIAFGTVWHGGLSGSAPLIMATPGNPLIEPATGAPIIDELIPVTETLFNPYNVGYLIFLAVVGLCAVLAVHPAEPDRVTLTPKQVEAIIPTPPEIPEGRDSPAGRIDQSRFWVLFAAALILYPLGHAIITQGFGRAWTIDAYNMTFLAAALLLHGRPDSFVRACQAGVGASWGIILQFPFYAGIFGVMNNTDLGFWLGGLFADVSSPRLFPAFVFFYSAVMNLFVPSAGSKWLIEAPYLIPAAQELGVSVKTVIFAYMYGDSTSNLIQPFWYLPLLTVTRLRFGDIVGYAFLVATICAISGICFMLLIPLDVT
jgi:short-chain fatty acids transporter